jgi:hypothetical protein
LRRLPPRAHAEPAQAPRRAGADDAVGRQAYTPLEAAHGSFCPRAESAVEPSRTQPVPPEQELEHGDVVAEQAALHDPRSVERPAERAQRAARAGPRQPVDGETVPALEDPNRASCLRTLDAVDRPSIEALLSQGDL